MIQRTDDNQQGGRDLKEKRPLETKKKGGRTTRYRPTPRASQLCSAMISEQVWHAGIAGGGGAKKI